jgi:molybdopterin-guanine dinucleotide biosynthesis protein B
VKVLGVIGWSGSGKTELVVAMIPLLRNHGLIVSTIKHTHHGFDMDRPGKDSFRHRAAGAHEVLVASGDRWALLHEVVGPEPPLPVLLEKLEAVDLVLVEGFKSHPFPKLEVHRPALGRPPIWPDSSDVVAVASDAAVHDAMVPVESRTLENRTLLPLNDPATVVVWIRHHFGI